MYVVLVNFEVHSQHTDAFAQRVKQQAVDSKTKETGCQVFDVCQSDDPNYIMLYEVYDDKAAFDAHLASAHFHDFDNEVKDWIADKSVEVFTRL